MVSWVLLVAGALALVSRWLVRRARAPRWMDALTAVAITLVSLFFWLGFRRTLSTFHDAEPLRAAAYTAAISRGLAEADRFRLISIALLVLWAAALVILAVRVFRRPAARAR